MNRITGMLLSLLLLAAMAGGSDLQDRCAGLTRGQLQSVIEFLSADALEGRAPGTRGGELAENYMYSLFKQLGLDTRFQPFALHGFRLDSLAMTAGGRSLAFPGEVVGSYVRAEKEFSLEGDAVFAGFGIRTPLWQWDDYKDADLRGKVLLVRVNDPGMFDARVFEGSALTYFGRWTYKIEEAARTGAAAILLIHTTPSAGYDWQVVRNSWSGEELFLPASLDNGLKFRGWISEASLRSLLAERKIDLERLYRRSLRRSFRPVDLGFKVRFSGRNAFRDLETRNVVAEIPGRSGKSIVLSAHIDHLGRDESLSGDQVFNGAIDNGSAVAALAMVAKVFAASAGELRHGLTFLACQGEEAGLLGSRHFVANSDRARILANINFESTPVWEASLDAFAEGGHYSTLGEMVRQVAAAQGLGYSRFTLADQGLFFRSDQFPFAQAGIPAIWLSAGEKSASGRNHIAAFFKGGAYHTVKDEFDPNWELAALRQTIQLAVGLIERLQAAAEAPRWQGRLPFPLATESGD
ncbi:MAG: M28 family peptidase [Acidobacteria bacterium]|jgi:Zn-dependent M28 family amino/carboxypeptidase|nr:M28 family peptidase [Acidobacteriota bacterium]